MLSFKELARAMWMTAIFGNPPQVRLAECLYCREPITCGSLCRKCDDEMYEMLGHINLLRR